MTLSTVLDSTTSNQSYDYSSSLRANKRAVSSLRWFPKLTPYRLVVLSTTIGLGTAKAISSYIGYDTISITLEWISGVVLFLVLHLSGHYDSPSSKPASKFLRWIFDIDCLDLLWKVLSLVCVPRPNYLSDELPMPEKSELYGYRVQVTYYRLLVSGTIFSFGVGKASLVYLDYPSTANWVDWTLAVVLTSFLYVLGLYEMNSLGRWSWSFVQDRRYLFASGSSATPYCAGVVACLVWTAFFQYALLTYWNDPGWGNPPVSGPAYAFGVSLKLVVGMFIVVCILAGIFAFILLVKLLPAPFAVPQRAQSLVQTLAAKVFEALLVVSPKHFQANRWCRYIFEKNDLPAPYKQPFIVHFSIWMLIALFAASAPPLAYLTYKTLKSFLTPVFLYGTPGFENSLTTP
ncbi:unnamed protein product [Cyclocybe aegerita]|uniref:Uncharacterized protein n=1 Tax=Cyclocybe aegerita TaxID=1973307 RepID=A0A8S0VVA3_CYCAE|nr:unnamed protein product [Cyclocybe aegerita]